MCICIYIYIIYIRPKYTRCKCILELVQPRRRCVSTGYICEANAAVALRLVVHCPSLPSHQSGRFRPVENPRGGKCGIECGTNGKGYGLYNIARGESERRAERFIHTHSAFGRRRTRSCLRLLLSRAPLRRDQVARKKNTVSESQEELVRPRSVHANVVVVRVLVIVRIRNSVERLLNASPDDRKLSGES